MILSNNSFPPGQILINYFLINFIFLFIVSSISVKIEFLSLQGKFSSFSLTRDFFIAKLVSAPFSPSPCPPCFPFLSFSSLFFYPMKSDTTINALLEDDLLDLCINDSPQSHLNELTLIGSIISDKVLNFRAVKSILSSAWNLGHLVQFAPLDRNLLSCTFTTETDRDCILYSGPWAMKGHLIVFVAWEVSSTLEELTFSHIPFWVNIYNLLLNRLNEENGRRLGNVIGRFLSHDHPPHQHFCHALRPYLRIRALVDVSKPLKIGSFIKRENGVSLWIQFRYERLSNFCYQCGRLGHTQFECGSALLSIGGVADLRLSFGPWLRTHPYVVRGESRWKNSVPHPPVTPAGFNSQHALCTLAGSMTATQAESSPTLEKLHSSREARCTTPVRKPLNDISNIICPPFSNSAPPGSS